MRTIDLDDVDDLAIGAVVLGTGGGGDPYIARLILREALRRHGPVRLVDPSDLDPDGLLLPVAIIGAPTAHVEKILNGDECRRVLSALEQHLGRSAVATMPLEVGGVNTLLPIAMAAELGLPCVDADLMRRAFPQVQLTSYTLAGIPACPMTLADSKGNFVLFDAVDNETAERLIRSSVAELGMLAVMSAYAGTVDQCVQHAFHGSVAYALEIGRRVRAIQEGAENAYARLLEYCDAQILFSGKVADIERRTTGGWASGSVTLEHLDDADRTMRIEIQNENLIAFENGRAVITVPDLITLIDVETAIPMTTESLAYGQRLNVLGMPAHERWHEPDGIALAGPRTWGYDIDYVPYGSVR
jgi:hypothetical protein